MVTQASLRFEGDRTRHTKHPHPDSPKHPEPYVISEPLKKAVNLAIYLQRPLLLEGDAGCGKTRLASAVAYELGLPLYRWDVRSTSKAQEGLYEYDAILRLHDVQAQKSGIDLTANEPKPKGKAGKSVDAEAAGETEGEIRINRDPMNPSHYRRLGALGKAFKLEECPAVVLIDEIDKADLDFPNDLLAVLDDPWKFTIRETGETIATKHKPIVFITSNKEKGNLPTPFLRRCLYHYVEFPNDPALLKEIVALHYQPQQETNAEQPEGMPPDALTTTAIARFLKVWNEGGLFKKPGTSEFLDWLKALNSFEKTPYSAKQLEKDKILPYRELLFKLQQDWKKSAKAS
jgi:MoxR-like ATPase